MPDRTTRAVTVRTVVGSVGVIAEDLVAVEEPLQIQLSHGPLAHRSRVAFATTMRTPGHDAELAAGFLLAEQVVRGRGDVVDVRSTAENVVRVDLHPDVPFDDATTRRLTVSSACGVCGRTTIDQLDQHLTPVVSTAPWPAATIHSLPAQVRAVQATFDRTGGLHAAALFAAEGELLAVREDVGRHNAVDKLIGAEFLAGRLPLTDRLIFVSGRASYELVQKAVAAGAAALAAVGAPSSLAVDTAEHFGLTLIGFVRDGRFNVYAGQGVT